ncbi:MAG: hypothetical protein ACYTDY_00710 [Planctomycetota bacterium]|jgi:hypothetical protein
MNQPRTNPRAARGARRATHENHYCSGCLRTRAFMDCGDTLRCPICRRELRKLVR